MAHHVNIQKQDLNLVFSSDAKPTLKWTRELHQRFVDLVAQLGGPEIWRSVAGLRLENVKASEVHTFLQHLVTFGIAKAEDFDLYWKLVVGPAWRKQMPKLAVSLGLGDKMPGIFLILHRVFGVYLI
ncbi:FRIGIDA-like protein 4a [Tanacetum coccineum]